MEYGFDYINGVKVPQTVIENDYILNNKNATVESDEYRSYINSTLESVKGYYGDVNGKL